VSQSIETWILLAQERYPKLNENEIKRLSMKAASEWYLGEDTELASLFDQYVMLKNLKGNQDGESSNQTIR